MRIHVLPICFPSGVGKGRCHERCDKTDTSNADVASTSFAVIIGLSAVGALVYSGFVLRRVMRSNAKDLDDRLGYGAGPLAGYVVTLVAAVFVFERSPVGPPLLAGALILLLRINIRNAWDLTVFFAQRRVGEARSAEPDPG